MRNPITEICRLINELRVAYIQEEISSDNYFRLSQKLWERYRKLNQNTDNA